MLSPEQLGERPHENGWLFSRDNDPHCGKTIGGRYFLTELIGQGGFALVYKATDQKLKRPVAIKLVPCDANIKDDYQKETWKRFIDREIVIHATVYHPNVLTLMDAGYDRENKFLYLVTPYLEKAEPLDLFLAKLQTYLRWNVIGHLFEMACLAVRRIHEAAVIHRDVKPSNVLIEWDRNTRRAHLYLIDLGSSRFAVPIIDKITAPDTVTEPKKDELEAAPTVIATTPSAMLANMMGIRFGSREQITTAGIFAPFSPGQTAPEWYDQERIGPAMDIFGLGIVFYALATKTVPYLGDSQEEFGKLLAGANLPKMAAHRPGVPPALDEFLFEQALAYEPGVRIQDALVLSREIKRRLPRETTQPGMRRPPAG